MNLGFVSAYIMNNNTIAWGRAKRIDKYRRLIGLVIGDQELIDIAVNTKGEDEPMAYAIMKMRKQSSLQTVLEHYNVRDPVYSFLYGAGKNNNRIYRNTSGATTWTGFRSLWALLNRIDKEHFDAAIQKTGEPVWLKTVGRDSLRTMCFTPIDESGKDRSRYVTDILYLYEKKMNE